MSDSQITKEQWLAIRKEAAFQIDPETAEVEWSYGQTLDPYGVNPDLPEEYHCIGRNYFARAPEATCGLSSAICRIPCGTLCGRSAGTSWPHSWSTRPGT
jgi:hypothetical protein